MKYRVKMEYTEKNGKHTLEETYVCSSEKEMRKTLGSVLDILVDKNGNAIDPDLQKLVENLGKYASEKDIKNEFKRMKKMTEKFNIFIDNIATGRYDYWQEDIDKNTEVSVQEIK